MIGFVAPLALALAGQPQPVDPARIRIALADAEPAARISAATPFTVLAGELRIEASDLLVGPETRPGEPALALGSFSTREDARDAERRFRGDAPRPSPTRPEPPLADEAQRRARTAIRRDPATGRFLVTLGPPADEATLRASGFPRTGRFPLAVPDGDALVLRPAGGLPIRIPAGVPLRILPGGSFLEWEGQPYRGSFEARRAGAGVIVVNLVPVEEYLLGVVPRELPPDRFPEPEALKAQALVARTYALRPRPGWRERGYDLCSGPACQVYGGVAAEHPVSTAAVRATAGEVLTHQGRLADALYTAACGGGTENAENVFTNPTPYLVARAGFREADGAELATTAAPVPFDAALADLAGALPPGWPGDLGTPAAPGEISFALSGAFDSLGLRACEAAPRGPRLDQYAEFVDALRCSPGERVRLRSSPLERLVAEGLLDPSELGLDPVRPVTRRETLSTVAALFRRNGLRLARGQVLQAGPDGLVVAPDRNPDEPIQLRGAPDARLYREIRTLRVPGRPDATPPPIPETGVRARPGDFVRYRAAADGTFELLVLEDAGETWDRFSAQTAWLVPKDNAALSQSLRNRYPERDIGRIVALEPLEFGASGRISRLRIRGSRGSLDVRGLAVRRALGLADTLFFAEPLHGDDGQVDSWWFTGRGWGHGLGLCQAGAYGMAAHGFDYRDILARYYPQTRVETRR